MPTNVRRYQIDSGEQTATRASNHAETEWNAWKTAMQETAATVLGHARRHREEWITDDTWILINEKKDLKREMETSDSGRREVFKNLHQSKPAEVKRATRRDRRSFYHRKADEAEDAAQRGDQRRLSKLAKDLGGIRRNYNGVIKDSNGNKIAS